MPSSSSPELFPADLAAVTLQREFSADEPFLFKLYCSTRMEEIAAWGWPAAQAEAFLKMQFHSQRLSYRTQFPDADCQIIFVRQHPAGRLVVSRTPKETGLIDIALLPEYRNQGIGSALLRRLLREAAAAGSSVRLQVLKGNRAAGLYARLGFSKMAENGPYEMLAWITKPADAVTQ